MVFEARDAITVTTLSAGMQVTATLTACTLTVTAGFKPFLRKPRPHATEVHPSDGELRKDSKCPGSVHY